MNKFEARVKALEAALQIDQSGLAGMVVKRAKVIEQYLITGEVPDLTSAPQV